MRDLINKLSLLESSNGNITKIASFFIPWKDAVDIPITFLFPFPVLKEKRMALFNLSYIINNDTGSLEYDPTRTIYMGWVDDKFITDFWDNFDWDDPGYRAEKDKFFSLLEDFIDKDLSLGDSSKIRTEVKNAVLDMGFSNEAAADIFNKITSTTGEVVIRFSRESDRLEKTFFNEVNAAYQWRQEAIGDL